MVEWLDIDDEQAPDVEDIMRQIRAYLAKRRRETAFSELDGQEELTLLGDVFSSVVYDELMAASQKSREVAVSLDVRKSSIPVVGRLVDLVRRKIHEVVVFYVNKGAEQQVTVNTHVVRALIALVRDLEERKATAADIDALRADVTDLYASVAALSDRLDA